jgi:hypothetical protein
MRKGPAKPYRTSRVALELSWILLSGHDQTDDSRKNRGLLPLERRTALNPASSSFIWHLRIVPLPVQGIELVKQHLDRIAHWGGDFHGLPRTPISVVE